MFNAETESVTQMEVLKLDKNEVRRKKSPSNTASKIELKGASLQLTEDVLEALATKVELKLVLTVEDGKAILTNPKLNPKAKGGNKISGKLSIACRGAVKENLEELGTAFGFKLLSPGVIELIPVGENEEVVQITEELDEVVSPEDLEALRDTDEEEVDFDLESLDLNN